MKSKFPPPPPFVIIDLFSSQFFKAKWRMSPAVPELLEELITSYSASAFVCFVLAALPLGFLSHQ